MQAVGPDDGHGTMRQPPGSSGGAALTRVTVSDDIETSPLVTTPLRHSTIAVSLRVSSDVVVADDDAPTATNESTPITAVPTTMGTVLRARPTLPVGC